MSDRSIFNSALVPEVGCIDAPESYGSPTTGATSLTSSTRLEAAPLGDLDFATIPWREWFLGRRFLKDTVTATVAPGGVGKSIIAIQEAIALVTGRAITGLDVWESGPVWVFNAEDPIEELQRRVAAVCLGFDVDVSQLRDKLFLNSGQDRTLIVAEERDGSVIAAPDVEALIEEVQRHGIKLVVVDPFVRMHRVSESDNGAMDYVVQQFQRVAWKTGCAIHLVHHTRKPPGGSSEGQAGNMDAGRGASAVAYASRVAHTLFSMSEKDADRLGISKDERHLYLRMDDAKANLSLLEGKPRWFRREGINLPNGDQVGIARPVDMEASEQIARDLEENERNRLGSEIVRIVGVGGAETTNKVVGRLREDVYATISPNTLRRRIERAVPMFPLKTSVTVEGVTLQLWRQQEGASSTSPWMLRVGVAG